ncbi:hypothetical protein [Leptolyngbya sp. AN10]
MTAQKASGGTALAQAIALNPYGDIADRVTWQRELRHDRFLLVRNYAD